MRSVSVPIDFSIKKEKMKYFIITLSATAGICSVALAEEQSYPRISGELSTEIQNDWTYSSDNPSAEINDLYPTVILGTIVELTQGFSFNLEVTLEPVEEATEDRAFKDLGGFLNIATALYETKLFSVYGGKFTPNFGIAWDLAPGIYGVDFNEDYELVEMIGFGGGINFIAAGTHTISASTFFQDTSVLSKSVGTQRGPKRKSDGGPANTEDLSSFTLAIDGEFEKVAGFRYHAGFSSLAAGEDGDSRQMGYVVGVEYAFDIGENIAIAPLAEYAYFDSAGGIKDDTAKYFTAGIAMNYKNWVASTTYQRRETKLTSANTDDFVIDFTMGYVFDMGLGVAAAWRVAEEEDISSKGLGLLVSYAINF